MMDLIWVLEVTLVWFWMIGNVLMLYTLTDGGRNRHRAVTTLLLTVLWPIFGIIILWSMLVAFFRTRA